MWKVSVAAWPSLGCRGEISADVLLRRSFFVRWSGDGSILGRTRLGNTIAGQLSRVLHAWRWAILFQEGREGLRNAQTCDGRFPDDHDRMGGSEQARPDLVRTTFLRPIRPSYAGLATGCTCIPHAVPCLPASSRLGHWHVPARLVQNLKTGRKSENTLTQRDKLPLGVALAACLGGRDQALKIVSVETERMKSQRTWWWWHSFCALCGA